jgi:transposase
MRNSLAVFNGPVTDDTGIERHCGVPPIGRERNHTDPPTLPALAQVRQLNDLQALEKALNRIRKAHPGATLELAYEAGPCGFGIARRLEQLKVPCLVAAPSLIPKQPGSPFKTDKRDARGLARLLRAGELTAVYVPEPTDEAMRRSVQRIGYRTRKAFLREQISSLGQPLSKCLDQAK